MSAQSESKLDSSPAIAIIGLGCLFPKANSKAAYWANITKKIDCITDIPETHWRPDDYYDADPARRDHTYARRGGFLSPVRFNPMEFGISPRDIEAIDTTQLLGMVVAKQALDDAGYGNGRDFDRKRTSVVLGVTGALEMVVSLGARLGHPKWRKALREAGLDDDVAEGVVERIADSYVDWQENSFPGLLGNVAAGRIANRFDFGGTNCVVDAACASSITALHLAGMELMTGRTDMVVTGGFDTFNDIFMYMCFSKTPALSPTGDAKPFDGRGDGTILGEGLGVAILKRVEDARRDGDRIYAVIRGIGTSSDGKGNAIYAPSIDGQYRALIEAYKVAGVSPRTVELVEGHGTGTKVGDGIEVQALGKVYGSVEGGRPWCALGSVKSQIGHTKAAAGIAGVIKAALALYHKVLPPTIKVKERHEYLSASDSPFYLNTEKRPWPRSPNYPRRAAVSSFGFGGSNFHCVMEESDPVKKEVDWDGDIQLLSFAADSKSELIERIKSFPVDQTWDELRLLAGDNRKAFDPAKQFRLTMVIENGRSDLHAMFDEAVARLQDDGQEDGSWQMPEGIYYSCDANPGKLGFLFPGQGSQYVGMFRDLMCRFPQMQEVLDDANAIFAELKKKFEDWRLSDFIYPPSSLNEEDDRSDNDRLRDTEIAQPALGAVSLGLTKLLDMFGISPDAVGGHSYGELPAVCAAGRIADRVLHMLSNIRGQLMTELGANSGGMLAVNASAGDIQGVIEKNDIDLTVANKNAPDQTVLSGVVDEIERALRLFREHKMSGKELNVAGAFHSSLVEQARKPFLDALKKIRFTSGDCPVYANASGGKYPQSAVKARELLASQLSRPVEFIQQIENMYDEGVRTFLEVGPKGHLSGLVQSILRERDHIALTVDSLIARRSGILALGMVLAQLAAMGYAIQIDQWDGGYKAAPEKDGYSVSLCGANQFEPRIKSPPLHAAEKAPALEPPASELDVEQGGNDLRSQINEPDAKAANTVGSAPSRSDQPMDTGDMGKDQTLNDGTLYPMSDDLVLEALRLTQENMTALQQMQTRTAELHHQFLGLQEQNQLTLRELMNQQQNLYRLRSGSERRVMPMNSTAADRKTDANQEADIDFRVSMPTPPAVADVQVPTISPEPAPMMEAPARAGSAPEVRANSDITEILFEVISEKTGYPPEMLSLDMGLDSDLGIDSIKRVEILSLIQERLPDSPQIGPEHLGEIQTVQQIVQYLGGNGAVPLSPASDADPAAGNGRLEKILLDVVSSKTGYPPDMLSLDMGLDTDLGVDSIKRVEILSEIQNILPELSEIGSDQIGNFVTLRDIVSYLAREYAKNLSPSRQTAASTAAEPATASTDRVASALLTIVSLKTGYPEEMLSFEMVLDGDLGIDSIKRVEILSAMQEKFPEFPEIGADQLANLQTLGEIVEFLVTAADNSSNSRPASDSSGSISRELVESVLLEIVADKTGYPADMINLEMGLDSDLGIDSIKRVEILSAVQDRIPETPNVTADQLGNFGNLGEIADYIHSQASSAALQDAPSTAAPTTGEMDRNRHNGELGERVDRLVLIPDNLAAHAGRHGMSFNKRSLVWVSEDDLGLASAIVNAFRERGMKAEIIQLDNVSALKKPKRLDGLVIPAPKSGADNGFFMNCVQLLQVAGPALQRSKSAFVGTISRMDGFFGLHALNGQSDPFSGGLAGLVKTVSHEWPDVSCKAIDTDVTDVDFARLSAEIVDELLLVGPIEVGLSAHGRHSLALSPSPLSANGDQLQLNPSDVVLVTGGGRGVTAEVSTAMARRWQPTLVLIGRSPEPAPEEDWLRSLTSESAIKKALLEDSRQKMTPKELEARYRQVMSNREILHSIERMRACGSTVVYRSVDVRDVNAVASMVEDVRDQTGPICGLVHGAGVLADRLIEEKTSEQFDRVFSTKVDGIRNLLDALTTDDLKFLAFFSSSTGRYGRKGQIDYAIANEILNKIAQREARRRGNCRIVSFNWGPWEGGMVTPELRKVFALEKINLIPLAAGAEYFVSEIGAGTGQPVEIVVLGANSRFQVDHLPGAGWKGDEFRKTLERVITVDDYPFLKSHVFDHQAVVPMSMMIEWMAHSAIHHNPGFRFLGFDNFKVNSRLSLHDSEALPIVLKTAKIRKVEHDFQVPVQLCRHVNENELVCAEGVFIIGHKFQPESSDIGELSHDRKFDFDDIYDDSCLFHTKEFRAIELFDGYSDNGISGWCRTAPSPERWIRQPLRKKWITDPLALDSAFQMMVLWSDTVNRIPSLPVGAGRYRQFVDQFPSGRVYIQVQITKRIAATIYANMEFLDGKGNLIAKVHDYVCYQDKSFTEFFRRNHLSSRAVIAKNG